MTNLGKVQSRRPNHEFKKYFLQELQKDFLAILVVNETLGEYINTIFIKKYTKNITRYKIWLRQGSNTQKQPSKLNPELPLAPIHVL